MPDEPTPSEIQLRIRQLLGQATLLRARGDHEQALALAQEAIALDDESWEGHELLGDLLLALEHPERAMTSYRQAWELNPERARLEEKIGRAALAQAARDRTTKLSRALLDGETAVEMPKRNPSYAALYSLIVPGLGQVYNREVFKGIVVVVVWLALFGITAAVVRTELAIRPTAPMGSLYDFNLDFTTLLSAAFGGPGAIWVLALVGVWIYAVADAAMRASKTMTSDHTGVV
jgi:tetratricopeptide (TPR) repeat protein